MKKVSRISTMSPVSSWSPVKFAPVMRVLPLEKNSDSASELFGSANLRRPTWNDNWLSDVLLTVQLCVVVRFQLSRCSSKPRRFVVHAAHAEVLLPLALVDEARAQVLLVVEPRVDAAVEQRLVQRDRDVLGEAGVGAARPEQGDRVLVDLLEAGEEVRLVLGDGAAER